MKLALFILAASLCWAQFPVDGNGWIITGLPAEQNNLLGPLIHYGSNPWIFGDLAEKGVADSMAPAALTYVPALGTPLAGTISWTQGGSTLNTTADLRSALSGQSWLVVTWTSVDGAGTGRMLKPIGTVTASTIDVSGDGEIQEPSSSGMSGYLLPPADSNGLDFQSWTTENPSTVWNYYDVAIALYRLYYRTANTTYQTEARQYADITWQWTLDHGYRIVAPRASTMLSQFFRALEGHSERFPGLYNWIATEVPRWSPSGCPNCDNREAGYETLNIATGAKTDPDPTRHAQYCSWLSTFVTTWNGKQQADGSFGENGYSQNTFYPTAPKAYALPVVFGAAPWREFVNATALESAYESLKDTSSQGCNNPSLATTTLTTITNLVTWIHNYGRDTSNRGEFYEVNYQSADQSHEALTGIFDVNVGSNALIGHGTNWQTAGYCDGTQFIGIAAVGYVYKIASCTSDTAATISVNFGFFGEASNVTGSTGDVAPAAYTGCASSATYCFGSAGDRNLTRPVCGAMGWLYSVTLNSTYKNWTDECISATLGGPTAGLTSAANIGAMTLPCSGPSCDGLVNDTVAAAANCGSQPAPCVNGSYLYSNLGKNFGEAFGAPGIDNALAWRLSSGPTLSCDLSGDMSINLVDISLMMSQVLHINSCTNRLDNSASCNVVDVARVAAAALGQACRLGP